MFLKIPYQETLQADGDWKHSKNESARIIFLLAQ